LHIGRFVTATIDQIDVSALTILLIPSPCHDFDAFVTQALVKHSQDKDQFLKVEIKPMIETQILEHELKELGELNLVLLKEKQELEAKLAEESQAKDGNHFPDSFSFVIGSCLSEL
jgi:hypothetical protein